MYSIFNRWLKHKEKMEGQRTARYSETVDGIVNIVKSNNLSKSIRSIASKKEQIESINKVDTSINTMLGAYMDSATAQVINEFENVSFKEGTPVREVEKTKRIDFPKKKKRSRRKSE